MSWSERYVQDHKRRTDCAIHRAFALLASDPPTFKKFQELLLATRRVAPRLFDAPMLEGHHLGVDALVNLSRFRDAHFRSVADWTGTSSSWRPAIASLAHHLLCRYKVPAFLVSSWWATDAKSDKKRGWFVAHSRGASFRSLNLPIAMTRKMEHIFLASPDHLTIECAMRRAELLALGAAAEVVAAILSTRLATDLNDGGFWRTVWLFLIANAAALETAQIGPIIDFIQAIRHDQRVLKEQEGIGFNSPQPEFSVKGRTLQSMLRLMRDWHRSLGGGNSLVAWARSSIEPLQLVEPSRDGSELPRRWQMMELTNSAQLRSEGAALHHCVASYTDRCIRGTSCIWSLRLWRSEKILHVITVEVDPKRRAVIQARGLANRAASGRPLRLLQDWATRERLRMAI
jgi:PcfJ-like protein